MSDKVIWDNGFPQCPACGLRMIYYHNWTWKYRCSDSTCVRGKITGKEIVQ